MGCKGRCVCGVTGPLKAVTDHVLQCRDWAKAYREDPSSALPPGEEYERWLRQDKAGERAAALREKVAETDAQRAAMAARFASRDILEDEGEDECSGVG